MNIKIDAENNTIKKVNIEMNPVEFMLFRHMLNLGAVHTELHEVDSRLANQMFHEIEEYIKEVSK